MQKVIILLALLIGASFGAINQTQHWFDEQLVDHFNPRDNSTYRQRYWVIDQYYNPNVGPILIYICGEYTCPGLPEARQFPLLLAQQFQGMILVPEHRYYGHSQPFGNESLHLDKMKFLTVDQALEDLAYFIKWVKENGKHGVQEKSPWLIIGGSYPGAMSAWFRYKYPHLSIGALASSAVVHAILNFTKFDEQIKNSTERSGSWCPQAIHDVNFYAQDTIATNKLAAQSLKKMFNAEKLKDAEFLWFLADNFVEIVQYGNREWLCNSLQNHTVQENLVFIAKYAAANNSYWDYGSYYLKNDTYTPNNDGSRQWTYQFCSEFGWLQTAPSDNDSMRSTWVNLTMYRHLCNDSFGEEIWPVVNDTNLRFGGENLEAFNIILTNGWEDPWRHAGVDKSKGNMIAYLQNCNDCGHCVELYTPQPDDPQPVKQTRANIQLLFQNWIDQYWINYNQTQKQQQQQQQNSEDQPEIHNLDIDKENSFLK